MTSNWIDFLRRFLILGNTLFLWNLNNDRYIAHYRVIRMRVFGIWSWCSNWLCRLDLQFIFCYFSLRRIDNHRIWHSWRISVMSYRILNTIMRGLFWRVWHNNYLLAILRIRISWRRIYNSLIVISR